MFQEINTRQKFLTSLGYQDSKTITTCGIDDFILLDDDTWILISICQYFSLNYLPKLLSSVKLS